MKLFLNKNLTLDESHKTNITPRLAMKGSKLKMKEYLRTQLLKTKHAYTTLPYKIQIENNDLFMIQDSIFEQQQSYFDTVTKNIGFKGCNLKGRLATQPKHRSRTRQLSNTDRTLMVTTRGDCRSQRRQKKSNYFISDNLQHRMNQYLNLILQKSEIEQQQLNKIQQDGHKILIKKPCAPNNKNNFYRKMKLSSKKINQIKRQNKSTNKFYQSQLLRKTQKIRINKLQNKQYQSLKTQEKSTQNFIKNLF